LSGSSVPELGPPLIAEPPASLRAGLTRRAASLPGRPVAYLYLVAIAVCLWLFTGNNSYNLFLASTVVVYAIAAIGQDWLIGRAGQVSIGGAAFMGIGAFTTVATTGTPLGHFPIPLIIAALSGAIIGVVVGLPASRLGGLYLVLTTLALQFVFGFVAQEYQGNRLGGIAAPSLSLFGWFLGGPRAMFVLFVVLLLAVVILLHNLYRYAPGNMWRAIRDDPLAAGTMGISVARWRMLAFVGSSAVTAIAGCLFAYLVDVVSYTTFTLDLGISLIVMVFVGGVGAPLGIIVGAALITYLPNLLTDLTNLSPAGSSTNTFLQNNAGTLESLVYGLLLVIVLLFEPEGLAGIARRLLALAERLVRRARSARAMPEPAGAASVTAAATTTATATATAEARTPAAEARTAPPVQVTEPGPQLPTRADNERAARALLSLRGLSIRYSNGGAGASDIDLDVPPGSVTAIVGRNGAGKTSTLRGIAGFLPAERVRVSGSALWKGQEIVGSGPQRTGRLGISLVPERFKVFPSLTVTEHFRAGGISGKREAECLEQFAGLRRFVNTKGGLLSGGERQLLAIALSVARHPQLLMVDELSLGLSPVATSSILDELSRAQREEQFAILLVDQAAGQISRFVDYYYLLEAGSIIGQGSAEEISVSQLRETVIGR
jgi:branched-chain amino acid transport system permease protein